MYGIVVRTVCFLTWRVLCDLGTQPTPGLNLPVASHARLLCVTLHDTLSKQEEGVSTVEFVGPNGEPLPDDSTVGDAAWHGGFDMTLDGKHVRLRLHHGHVELISTVALAGVALSMLCLCCTRAGICAWESICFVVRVPVCDPFLFSGVFRDNVLDLLRSATVSKY